MEYSFSLNLPYPFVEGKISPNTMAMLMEAYAGKTSEFTGIALYTYQHYFLKQKYGDLAKLLTKISIVEMQHLDMIGEAIVTFGGKPLYSGAYSFWNGSFVSYQEDIVKILKENIQAEQSAIRLYEEIISSTQNQSLNKLLSRIIMDEQLHLNIFETELNKNLSLTE